MRRLKVVEEVEEAGEFAAEAEYSSEAARIHFALRLKVPKILFCT